MKLEDTKFISSSKPKQKKTRAVLFVPGINAEKQLPLYEMLKDQLNKGGIHSECLKVWNASTDLGEMCIAKIVERIHESVSSLLEMGYTDIYGIGKSFGGGMLLAANDKRINILILWAPAIGFSETDEGNFNEMKSKPFSDIDPLLSITLGKNFLREIDIPVHIVHGTSDDAVSIENSETLNTMLSNSKLHLIEGMGHSPKKDEEVIELVHVTMEALKEIE